MPKYLRDSEQFYSLEAEAAVIGSMMIDVKCIPEVLAIIIRTDMFFVDKHQVLFEAIMSLHIQQKPAEAVLLRTELKRRKKLKMIGGVDYIKKILDSVVSSANALYYAKIVRERYNFRKMLSVVEEISKAPDGEGDVNEHIEKIQELALGLQIEKEDKAFTFKEEATESVMALADQRHAVETPFTKINNIIGGFFNFEFIIVAGRPGMGKSVFVGDIALHVAQGGKKVIMFSLEMSAESIAQRSICALASIDGGAWNNKPPQEEFDKAIETAVELEKYNITIYETVETPEKMYAIVSAAQRAGGIDLVVIDNIQLMQTVQSRSKEYERLASISRNLKKIAHQLKVPVLCISHLNREVEKRTNHRPRMSDLRGSGTIEQDSDMVILLHREDQYRRLREPDLPEAELDGIAEVTIAKNRRGKTGICKLLFREEFTHFANLAPEYLGEE